jgi:hypothetical protein
VRLLVARLLSKRRRLGERRHRRAAAGGAAGGAHLVGSRASSAYAAATVKDSLRANETILVDVSVSPLPNSCCVTGSPSRS